MVKIMTKTEQLAIDFLNYVKTHPNERFWQAFRNWVGCGFIYVSNKMSPTLLDHFEDTFFWTGRNK